MSRHLRVFLLVWSGTLFLSDGAIQAQLGKGSGSGGVVGQGGPDITRPETGGDAPLRGTGSPDRSGGII